MERFRIKTKEILEQFFEKTDWAKYSKAQELNIFITAKDNISGENLGIIQFLISPEFGANNIKAALFGVIPAAQNRDLELLLISSVFKIKKDIKRIFLHTRSTNKDDIERYITWGFTEFAGKIPNWTDLEYLISNSDKLQKKSEELIIQD